KALIRLSRVSGYHPRCFSLSKLERMGDQVAAGGFGDIWKGLVKQNYVAVKAMRIFQAEDVKAALKEFGREALISPWMDMGHIVGFLKTPPWEVDRVTLILDVAIGLDYLHGECVVHGDLKGVSSIAPLKGIFESHLSMTSSYPCLRHGKVVYATESHWQHEF
ncbi:hypothetical protein B0H13DRAFT_1599244, partial [Mycena leptocephala]